MYSMTPTGLDKSANLGGKELMTHGSHPLHHPATRKSPVEVVGVLGVQALADQSLNMTCVHPMLQLSGQQAWNEKNAIHWTVRDWDSGGYL